jgi:hypothetical protein
MLALFVTLTFGAVTLTFGAVTLTFGAVTLTFGAVRLTFAPAADLGLEVELGAGRRPSR